MVCFHPITVWQQTEARLDIPPRDYYELKKVAFHEVKGRQKIEIPCGRCLGCRLDHANMWATRIFMESKCWDKCCFVTLTYNSDNLPVQNGIPQLVKRDIQNFMKRLRWHEKGHKEWVNPLTGEYESPIRYFCCGEYGPKNGRPHYHLAIFNWEPKDLKLYKINKHGDPIFKSKTLKEIWGKGFVVVGRVSYKSAAYIARYVQKKAGLESEPKEYTGNYRKEQRIDERNGQIYDHWVREQKRKKHIQQPEFILMSRGVGIGRAYWQLNKNKIKKNKGIFVKTNDKVVLKPIPRYFKKIWEDENYEEFHRFKYEQHKDAIRRKNEIISRIKMPDGTTKEEKWEFYLAYSEKILKDKAKYLKRNEFI